MEQCSGETRSVHLFAGVPALCASAHWATCSAALAWLNQSRLVLTSGKRVLELPHSHLCVWWLCVSALFSLHFTENPADGTCISRFMDRTPFYCSRLHAALWLFADVALIAVALPVFSYLCRTLLHFRFSLCCWHWNIHFWQTAVRKVLINIAFQLKYVVSVRSSGTAYF